jgi:hypothetical protein
VLVEAFAGLRAPGLLASAVRDAVPMSEPIGWNRVPDCVPFRSVSHHAEMNIVAHCIARR